MISTLLKWINFYALAFIATLIGTGHILAQTTEGTAMPPDSPRHSEPLPLPRDPDIAVQEEFDAARGLATIEGWELFLARHGDHRLAKEARNQLEQLRQKPAR